MNNSGKVMFIEGNKLRFCNGMAIPLGDKV
jgi:hypothetical protein